jgi:hypothetical protein
MPAVTNPPRAGFPDEVEGEKSYRLSRDFRMPRTMIANFPMKVRFDPTQLEAAVQAPLLCRLIEEMQPKGMFGEVALIQPFRQEPMRLELRTRSGKPVAVPFDREILYRPEREKELRERVQQLFAAAPGRLNPRATVHASPAVIGEK